MTDRKPIQNKPLLIAVVGAAVAAAITVVSLKSAMGHDEARTLATTLMQQVCATECASHGITQQDLQGPTESEMNRVQRSTKFEFAWQASDGRSLHIRVWDNGLTIQKAEKWNDMTSWKRL